jgi:hypothetical protein
MTFARASRVSLSQSWARCRASVVASSLTRRNDSCKRKTVYLQAIGVRITSCRVTVTRRRAMTVTVREPYDVGYDQRRCAGCLLIDCSPNFLESKFAAR